MSNSKSETIANGEVYDKGIEEFTQLFACWARDLRNGCCHFSPNTITVESNVGFIKINNSPYEKSTYSPFIFPVFSSIFNL
jgi:hypothetical protein